MNRKLIEADVDSGKNNNDVAKVTISSTKEAWEAPILGRAECSEKTNNSAGVGSDIGIFSMS